MAGLRAGQPCSLRARTCADCVAGSSPAMAKMETASLMRGLEYRLRATGGFDLSGLLFAKLHDMVEQLVVVETIGGLAVEIDHAVALARAAACEGHVCLASLARTVHHATDDRQRHRGRNVFQPVFKLPDSLDDVEALARAAGARDDVHAAMSQVQRLEDVESDAHLFHGIGGKRNADRVADA